MSNDRTTSNAAEEKSDPTENKGAEHHPAAGPHAKPHLTDEEKTPGAGTLPDVHEDDVGDGASS